MEDRIDEILRRTLASHPRPQPSPTLAADVLENVRKLTAARQRAEEQRQRHGARLVLAAYWFAASVGSAWIVQTLPWPVWGPAVLWGLALTVVPLGYATFLWPQSAARWAALCFKPLLVDARGEPS